MAEPGGPITTDGEWGQWKLQCRENVLVCQNLSHLLYRLHTATNQKLKFVLSTHCGSFERDIRNNTNVARRFVMALDPEFMALMLRSSAAIAGCALSLITLLARDRTTARHLSPLLPHASAFLSYVLDAEDFAADSATKALLKRSECTVDLLKSRLLFDCLSFYSAIAAFLGLEALQKTTMDALDLSEAVDALSKDMFDLEAPQPATPQGDTDLTSCHLCSLIESREFKEAALQVEQVERDLDALASAHLEEFDAQSAEASAYPEDSELCMGPLLLKAGEAALQTLAAAKGDNAKSAVVNTSLSSLRCTLDLIPRPEFATLVTQCLSCGSLDVMVLLFELCTSSRGSFCSPATQTLVASAAAKLLEQSLQKSGVALVSSFVAQMVERHGFAALGFTDSPNTSQSAAASELITRLSSLVRRSEIEIHLALDDFFRRGSLSGGVNASFQLLEVLIVRLCDDESLLPPCHDLFTTIHRTMTTVFEFFDEVDHANRAKAASLVACCARLIGCWMSLEPMHLRGLVGPPGSFRLTCSQYLRKLPKMLSVISPEDLAWLLPSFEYLDSVDLDGLPSLFPLVLGTLSQAAALGNSEAAAHCHENRTLSLCYRLIERVFLEGMGDCALLFASVDTPTTDIEGLVDVQPFDFGSLLDDGNIHFSPRAPLEVAIPLPLDAASSPAAANGARCSALRLQSHFLSLLRRWHENRVSTDKQPKSAAISLGRLQDALDRSLTSMGALRAAWSQLLCEASLATAAVCLCRLHQRDVREWLDSSAVLILMECLAISFAYASPQTAAAYAVAEEPADVLWHRIALACTVLMQRQPQFVNVFAFVCRKIDEVSLQRVMGHFGRVRRCRVVPGQNARSAAEAFVLFKRPEEAAAAVKADEKLECGGCTLKISLWKGGFPPQQATAKRGAPSDDACWFCLSNAACEDHMVAFVSEHSYIAIAKGPISPSHSLVTPVYHYSSAASAPRAVLEDMQQLVDCLFDLCLKSGKGGVAFERYMPMQNPNAMHTQVQVVPVPLERAMDAFAYVNSSEHFGGSRRESLGSQQPTSLTCLEGRTDGPGRSYFYLQAVGRDPSERGGLVHSHCLWTLGHRGSGRRIPITFGRELILHLLPDSAADTMPCSTSGCLSFDDAWRAAALDWRNCVTGKKSEEQLARQLASAIVDAAK
ncbi:CwfJ C-terminus 1-like protein, putative [Babesia caballi]|uniref:CwfJ C-terminus 1-like protein, putative n=1 Tax=Babesia caballi TaxID=5871 RepID=A0AAV4LTA5_BABCB|nr:CwfJ C-terminus 1-like protein, putative [Babesia caballi]